MKKIALLGSTGSIGKQTLNVVRHLSDSLSVVALAAKKNIDLLEKQALEFRPEIICVFEEKAALELKKRQPSWNIVTGIEGLSEVASYEEVDTALMGMSGTQGILPIISAIKAGKEIALGNKEIIVAAGEYVMGLAKKYGTEVISFDSEHSAIFQCLQGESIDEVRKIILTASGGPFIYHDENMLDRVTAEEAKKHPNWNMGVKVSIDSSTLMNKGFEVIEAKWLFGLPIEKIEVLIHPESLVHSFVEFIDGSIKAQLAIPNMELPIQYALTHPKRQKRENCFVSFKDYTKLHFFEPDLKKFKCLDLAYQSLRLGGTMPCVLNAANEVLVERFCMGEVSWRGISEKLEKLLENHANIQDICIDTILEVDKETRIKALSI